MIVIYNLSVDSARVMFNLKMGESVEYLEMHGEEF
jgi:hypothetical protein